MLENNIKMFEQGAMELRDLITFWFPTLTSEEVDEKVERIKAERQSNTQSSIESMLNL